MISESGINKAAPNISSRKQLLHGVIPDQARQRGTILYCNSRFAEMTRCPIEQVIGAAWPQFFPPDEEPKIRSFLARSGTAGSKGEFVIQARGGALLPVQLSARPLHLDGIKVLAVLVTDIAELKAAHQALHLANERLESRVRERTGELAQANGILRAEMADRAAAGRALAEAQAKLRQHAETLEKRMEQRTAKLRDTVAELDLGRFDDPTLSDRTRQAFG